MKTGQWIKFNWQIALVAVLLAVSLWYTVVGREKVEGSVEVRLEIKGLSSRYILDSSPPDSIRVRLRGPEGLMRALDRRNLQYTLDLSSVARGNNIITISADDMPFSGAFDVLEITPRALEFFVDVLSTRKAVVNPVLRNDLPKGLRLEEMESMPRSVVLRGPESVLSNMATVNATVAMLPDITGNFIQTQARISTPPGVSADPSEVDIDLAIRGVRKVLVLQIPVSVVGMQPDNSSLDPEVVQLELDVPLAWSANGPELKNLKAWVEIDEEMTTTQNLPVKMEIPEDSKVIKQTPNRLKLTIL